MMIRGTRLERREAILVEMVDSPRWKLLKGSVARSAIFHEQRQTLGKAGALTSFVRLGEQNDRSDDVNAPTFLGF